MTNFFCLKRKSEHFLLKKKARDTYSSLFETRATQTYATDDARRTHAFLALLAEYASKITFR